MFFRILKLDLKKKKVMNTLLLMFIILASIFSASGLNNIATIMNGTDYYLDKAGIGNYSIVASRSSNVEEILKDSESVKSYKSEPGIIGMRNNIKKDGEKLEMSTNLIFQAIEDSSITFFDSEDEEITNVKKGEVYVAGKCMRKNNLSVGDELTVDLGDVKFDLKIAGKAKDAFLGSDFMGMTRFILNKEDYQKIYDTMFEKSNGEDNSKKGYKIFYIETDNPGEMDKILGNASAILFKGSRDVIKITYVMDMIIAFIVLVLSIGLIIVSLLVLKFTITFTLNEEYREIGVMKAIGINNKSVRKLYIIKYMSLAIVGAVIGFLLSIPFGNMLIKSSTENMVLGNTGGILVNVIGVIFIVLVTALFAYIYTGKVKKASPVDSIRNGQTGERYKTKTIYKLKNSHLRLNMYMAINDILSAPKRFITIILSFFVCLVLVLSIVITTDTMKSKNLISTFCTESDVYFIPGDGDLGDIEQTSREDFEENLREYEELFDENGMPCKMCIEIQFSNSVILDGNTYNLRTLQGVNTKVEDYVYYEGMAPIKDNEVAISDVISKKIGAKIGDKIVIDTGTEKNEFIVTAYFQSLNNMGEVIRLNENVPNNYKNLSGTGWFQINFTDNPSEEEIKNRIEKIKELVDSDKVLDGAGMCAENIGVVPTMETVQLLLLAITIIVVILVTLLMELSFVTNEKSQIALLKAVGFKNIHIRKWHMYRFLISTIISEILAAIFVIPITKLWCNPVFGMMGANNINYLINPVHVYLVYPGIVLGVTIVTAWIAATATNKIKSSDTANIE